MALSNISPHMKVSLQLVIFIILSTVFTGCGSAPGWTTRYKAIDLAQFADFDCGMNETGAGSLRIISVEDIKECYFKDTSRITWLLFVHMDCKKSVWQEFELYKQYSDNINFIIINDDFNKSTVKNEMDKISHPVYFIDPVYCNYRTRNTRLFIKALFNDEVARDFSSNFITHRGEILEMTWDVDEEMLEKAIKKVVHSNE